MRQSKNQNDANDGSFRREKSGSFYERVSSIILANTTENDNELRREVSFLRSTTTLSSVPDLQQYAKSWSVSTLDASNHKSVRKRTVSESSHYNIPDGQKTATPVQQNSIKRAHSLHRKVPISRQISGARQNPTSFLYLNERDTNSRLSLPPSGPTIREEDESDNCEEKNLSEISMLQAKSSTTEIDDNKTKNTPCQTVQKDMENGKMVPTASTTPKQHSTRSKFAGLLIKLVTSCFNMKLIKRPRLILMTISVSLMATGAPHVLFFIHAHAKTVGIEPSRVTKILSISAIVDLIARLLTGFVADLNIVKVNYIYTLR